MYQIGAYEAKTKLSDLLDRVAKGESITITRHGHPIARLVPVAEPNPASVARAAQDLRRLRRRVHLGGIPLKELIDEARS